MPFARASSPRRSRALLSVIVLVAGCRGTPPQSGRATDSLFTALRPRLSTGARLDPVGTLHDVGSLPLTMVASPDGRSLVLSLDGYGTEGVQIVDRATGAVRQTLEQRSAFIGLAFSPDGSTLYSSGGDQDVVYRYDWRAGSATLRDSLIVAPKPPRRPGQRFPAGLAPSPDGRFLYVAENLADSLAVFEVASGRIAQRLATGRYPYAVAVSGDGTVYVSAWGGNTVSVFTPQSDGALAESGRLTVGRHPSALLLSRDGGRLFVASASTDRVIVVDTRARRVVGELRDPPPAGPDEGTTPNAIALSTDGTRLFAAEGDANAVAVFDLSAGTSGIASATGSDALAGRIPMGWYPSAVLASNDTLITVSAKGRGSLPNPQGPQPIMSRERQGSRGAQYTLAQLSGTVTIEPLARVSGAALAAYDQRVVRANRWDQPSSATAGYPPFQHVIYVIKENRTYDQVLGDLPQGDGDTSLVFFPRAVSPNHHALAERFGLFDRFFVNAEVSADGHNWSTAAYASDYLEKTVQANYSGRRWPYDYEGTNRGFGKNNIPDDDVNAPASGYLWDLAERKGLTFRNYGEFVVRDSAPDDDLPAGYRGNKPFLRTHTNPLFPGFDLDISDQHRADVWIAELQKFVQQGSMPQLEIVRLPNDHTAGARAGAPTPRAYMADNDLALGRMIEALSRTPFWKSTVVFVLEDDAQNGPDHVDSHRSPLLVISPYSAGGTIHRFANTTDVIRTIEEILGTSSLAHFDYYARPLRDVWSSRPDDRPYVASRSIAPLDEKNAGGTREARESSRLDLRLEDLSDDDLFNRILWGTIKGPGVPYPGARRMSALEVRRGE